MTVDRYEEIQIGQSDNLTQEEVDAGWYFCNDCDGLLVNKEDLHICQNPDKLIPNLNFI